MIGKTGQSTFENIEEIKKEFSISTNELKEIRDELIKKLAKETPKTEDGKFESDIQETSYYRNYDAIAFVDDEIDKSRAIIPVNDIYELVKFVKNMPIQGNQTLLEANKKLDIQIEKSIENDRLKIFIPKISFTVLSAILSFLWLFPATLESNPYLNSFVNSKNNTVYIFFTMFYILILLFTFLIWIKFALRELWKKEIFSKLKSDEMQNTLFLRFLESLGIREGIGLNSFLKKQLKEFIVHGRKNHNEYERYSRSSILQYYFGYIPIDDEVADCVADIIITKGLEKGFLEKEKGVLFEDRFKLKFGDEIFRILQELDSKLYSDEKLPWD